ncbi:MAG: sigma-70 family RNA polymerase sigma factor [Gemmatimonadetes bacterium]|jgi:RNA polymerase sigma factor (sigma-70 family)|nr:sigma-70 family RNA polymerase sigma factor [Gemmatimonadota bacterium]
MSQDGLDACVRAAQGGSLRDFETLVQRFQDMAVGYSRVLLNDFHLAEDAAQDAFIQAYMCLGQLQNADAFPGWFRQIVFSCCTRYRHRRKEEVHLETVAYLIDPAPLPDAALARKEWTVLLDKALASLSEAEKTVLTLHYIREHSLREMAAFLEVSPTTIKNRLRSAKEKMHGRLLTMAREHMAQEAPSQDKNFARKVLTKVEATCLPGNSALVGSLHGICNAAGNDYSLAKVNSLLGYSFHFCIRPEGAVTEHHSVIEWALFFNVLDRLGFATQHFEAYLAKDWHHSNGTRAPQPPTTDELAKLREDTWSAVRASIDRGIPAIAWSPMTTAQKEERVGAFEWGLLVGYDEDQQTYTVHHRWRSNKPFTVPYDEFGYNDAAQWYYVIVFGDHTPPDERAITVAALEDAVSYARGTHYDKDVCCYPVAAVGFAAYEVWRGALVAGLPDAASVRHNAGELKFNRQQAAEFLRESADLFDAPVAQELSDAAACYDMEVTALTEVRDIARAAYEAGEFSATHRREAVSGVAAACEAEKLAIGHIQSALAIFE